MFKASQFPSEEALPALGAEVMNEVEASCSTTVPNVTTKLKSPESEPLTYGLTNTLPAFQHKYPKAVFFILASKFFEAFAANGLRTILALYLRDDLYFSENFSTIMLHIFNFFGQFCPIFGAIIADCYLGNVKTISAFCYLYISGWILLIWTSFPNIGVSLILLVSMSLLFTAIGNGSIRACITSLGASQFKIPEQASQLADYFSFYYIIYYFGIFLSKLIPPFERANTSCVGKNECYPAVFGTLGGSFVLSWTVFSFGKFFYKSERVSEDNMLIRFCGCIKKAILVTWGRSQKVVKRKYWLHNAIGSYDEVFVNDVARVLKISKLFITLPVYFALLAQQDSSWTFQATMMNTTFAGITIQPDQAKAIGPVFLFILIPLWSYICAPFIKKCFNFELKPLQSVAVGGILSSISFVLAGILQHLIVKSPLKSVSILWQMPQFLFLMFGELLLSIPGLQFAFTHAPVAMKSVVTATWFLNNAFGNLIVVFITKLNLFSSQTSEYFLYAFLMLIATLMFTALAYEYVIHETLGFFTVNTSRLHTSNDTHLLVEHQKTDHKQEDSNGSASRV